jgi:hypothetical protein
VAGTSSRGESAARPSKWQTVVPIIIHTKNNAADPVLSLQAGDTVPSRCCPSNCNTKWNITQNRARHDVQLSVIIIA